MTYVWAWRVHIQRMGRDVNWWVQHPRYGQRQGWERTHGGAWSAARWAIGDFIQGLAE